MPVPRHLSRVIVTFFATEEWRGNTENFRYFRENIKILISLGINPYK